MAMLDTSCCAKLIIFISSIACNAAPAAMQDIFIKNILVLRAAVHAAAYELLCKAQQDLKIVHSYSPALPLLSSIACNAAAMLKDSGRMYGSRK
jgi:hypothetical protein